MGIRRYGAHGISHQYVARRGRRFLGRPLEELALVVLHLGNGASAAAVRGGRPVDTSMGLTPLEGLVMGTRPGDLDPGVLLHLLRRGYDVDELEDLLHHRSGLQGLAGRARLPRPAGRGRRAATSARGRRTTSTATGCASTSAPTSPSSAAPTRWCSPPASASTCPGCARTRCAGWPRSGIEVDPARNRADADGPRRVGTDGSPVDGARRADRRGARHRPAGARAAGSAARAAGSRVDGEAHGAGPRPVAHLGQVLAVLAGPRPGPAPGVAHLLAQRRGARAQRRAPGR